VSQNADGALPGQPVYRFFIKDLGSLNGVYIDDVKLRGAEWAPLHESARLRFAPQTRAGMDYTIAMRRIRLKNQARMAAGNPPVSAVPPAAPLLLRDCHLELRFSHTMSQACMDQLAKGIPAAAASRVSVVGNGRLSPSGAGFSAAAAGGTGSALPPISLSRPFALNYMIPFASTAPSTSADAAAAAAPTNRRDGEKRKRTPSAKAAESSAVAADGHFREDGVSVKRACHGIKIEPLSSYDGRNQSTAATAATVAAASLSCSAATGVNNAYASGNSTLQGLLDEYTCGICSEAIYQCVVLGQVYICCCCCTCQLYPAVLNFAQICLFVLVSL